MKKLIALLLAIVLILGITACSATKDTKSEDNSKTEDKTDNTSDKKDTEEPPEEWTEASATESLTYLVSADCTSLDIAANMPNLTSRAISYLLFDPLLSYDEDGNTIGWLVESYEFSDDYKTATLNLRNDVWFTNGVQLTSEDVVFSLERICFDTEAIPSERNWRPYIESLEAIDEFTVKVNFIDPMPAFNFRAGTPETQIICKSAFEEMGSDAYWMNPVGTGAYVVESWDPANSKITLTLRTDEHGYWAYDAFGTYTNVKNITISYSSEGETRVSALRAGDCQIIDVVPLEDLEILKSDGYVVNQINGTTVVFLETKCGEGDMFENQKLRQALSMAIDRDLVVDTLLGGSAIAATWPCRSGDLGWIDGVSETGYKYDPDTAKKLVEESGYDGSEINFIFSTSTVSIGTELAQALVSMWEEIGLNVKINMQETAIYEESRENGDYDVSLCCMICNGNTWLPQAMNEIGKDRWNTGYVNEELKALGNSIAVECDTAKAKDLFEQAYKIEVDFCAPAIDLYFPMNYGANVSNISGIQWHGLDTPDLSTVVIK